jgi:hypothetical protein
VDYYNHRRLHETIGNVTPDDMYHGCQCEILTHREKIRRLTLQRRKRKNLRNAAQPQRGAGTLATKNTLAVPKVLTMYSGLQPGQRGEHLGLWNV